VPLLILFKLREKCQTLSGKLYNSTAGNIKGDNLVYIWLLWYFYESYHVPIFREHDGHMMGTWLFFILKN